MITLRVLNKMNDDKLLIEKYRPNTFDEYIYNVDDNVKFIRECVENKPFKLPNLILTSTSPGTGKTTLAKLITSILDSEMMYLNASDERGIDVIRRKVKEFVRTIPYNADVPKIIHFDEADGLTKDAQDMLRNLIEESSETCRFIFTCNNIHKIIDPLKSRCRIIDMSMPDIDKIRSRLNYIRKKENIKIHDVEMTELIGAHYPDIRSMIVDLESGDIRYNNNVSKLIYDALKEKDEKIALKLSYDRTLNHRQVVCDMCNLYLKDNNLKYIELLAECDYRLAIGSTPEIQLVWLVKEILK